MNINRYHYSHSVPLKFYAAKGGRVVQLSDAGSRIFYGYEQEVEFPTTGKRDAAAAMLDGLEGRYALENDCSLAGGRSFEIISQPATLAAHMAGFGAAEIESALDANGANAHDTHTCGLHIHATRAALGTDEHARDLAIAKICIIMARFQPQLIKLARRDYPEERWCRPNAYDFNPADGTRAALRKLQTAKNDQDRYHALNLTNAATIEFRIFRSTTKASTVLASLQLVDAIIKFAMKKTTPEVNTCTFGQIVQFAGSPRQLVEYCAARGVELG